MAVDYLLVVAGAVVGAPLRYLADRWARLHLASRFPWGIFAVNVAGSAIIGLLAGAAMVGAESTPVGVLLGTGLCGALTTYSTLSYETAQLAERRAFTAACANLFGSVAAGIAAVTVGYLLTAGLVG